MKRKYINKYGTEHRKELHGVKKSHLDPTAGLFNVAGNCYLHLGNFITILVLETTMDESAENKEKVTIAQLMKWVHLTCFVLMQIELVSHYFPTHIQSFFKHLAFLTMPLMQASVLYIFDFYTANQELGCSDKSMIDWWIKIEIYQFYIYIALTPWTLLKSRFLNTGLVQNNKVN